MKSYNGFTPQQRTQGDKIIKEAIEAGRLPRLEDCSCKWCGQTKGIKHYHCEDYSPENIIDSTVCLCWRCHMMLHTRFYHPNSFAKYVFDVTLYNKMFEPVYRGNAWEELEQHYID